MKKNFIILCLLCLTVFSSGAARYISGSFHIDATTNANRHNTMGIDYLRERCYYAAIQEFKIAISLNENAQSTAIAYNNLGKTYMAMGLATYAQDCFERAIKLYGLNFEYYQNLADCYTKLKKAPAKLQEYRRDKSNPLNQIMVGLLELSTGNRRTAIITLDAFCMSEPDLIVTDGVREFLSTLTGKK